MLTSTKSGWIKSSKKMTCQKRAASNWPLHGGRRDDFNSIITSLPCKCSYAPGDDDDDDDDDGDDDDDDDAAGDDDDFDDGVDDDDDDDDDGDDDDDDVVVEIGDDDEVVSRGSLLFCRLTSRRLASWCSSLHLVPVNICIGFPPSRFHSFFLLEAKNTCSPGRREVYIPVLIVYSPSIKAEERTPISPAQLLLWPPFFWPPPRDKSLLGMNFYQLICFYIFLSLFNLISRKLLCFLFSSVKLWLRLFTRLN